MRIDFEAHLDKSTNVPMSVDYAHHEIHDGSHFFYTDSVSINSAGTQDYLITTPNTTKWAHMVIKLDGSAITQFDLYEGADRDGTAAGTIWNNNRNSSATATVTVHKGQSGGTTDGTLIRTYKGGAATAQARAPTENRSDSELVLKQNTKYLVRFTSGTNSNLCNIELEWYEHTNKTT